jgi:hypothetical protein
VSFAGLRARLGPWLEPDSSSFDLAVVLSFLMFVFYADDPGFPFMVWGPLSAAVLMAGLVWPRLRRSPYLWAYLTIAMLWARLPVLTVMDNHHYLIAYWFIAVTACLVADPDEPAPGIARNARLLVGLAMAFAVVAKLRSGEFANGDFFEFLLLAGQRFEAFSELVLRIPAETLAANREAVAALVTPGASAEPLTRVTLEGPPRAGVAALLLSLWTLAIETACAIAFLWPGRAPALRVARNASLLLFCVTTYAVATVGAFAWILVILGVAQCEKEDRMARFAYSATFLLVLVYAMPWGDWLRRIGEAG